MQPRASGLPSWVALLWFPALIALGAAILVALNISGTSSGAHWVYFGTGQDPDLLIGQWRAIRSDEWLVHQAWVISQVQQGFPVINETLPGGMDVSVALSVPVLDGTVAFRPHNWGYFLFGADAGVAWEWWMPAFLMVSGAYMLVITYLPKRPLVAAGIACAAFFTPIIQWWYGLVSVNTAAFGFLALAALVWIVRDDRLWVRIVWSAVVGWLAAVMAMALYAPFMIPVALAFVLVLVGTVLNARRELGLLAVVRRFIPLVVAGALAVGAVVIWLAQRSTTVAAIGATVYPGDRLRETGQALSRDPFGTWFGGAVWGQSFRTADGATALGPNTSEAASVLLIVLFLSPALVYFLVRRIREKRGVDWVIVSVLALEVVVLAAMYIPGWDALAHLLFLDRVPMQRFWIAFAVLTPLVLAIVIREVAERAPARVLSWATVAGVAAIHGLLLWRIIAVDPDILQISSLWWLALLGLLATCFFVLRPRGAPVAVVGLLVSSLVIAGNVNPLYKGAFDLRETQAGEAISAVEEENPGVWLGVGSQEVMALLMESGVEAYNGVQMYPPDELWANVDPSGRYENAWNRLGHIQWAFGSGEPVVETPQLDVIRSTFDPCSAFAQEHVDYVVTDQPVPESSCLQPVRTIQEGILTVSLLQVVEEGER